MFNYFGQFNSARFKFGAIAPKQVQIESMETVGKIVLFSTVSEPVGWLLCDGAAHEKLEYPELFDLIGNDFGGEASDTFFKVPDIESVKVKTPKKFKVPYIIKT